MSFTLSEFQRASNRPLDFDGADMRYIEAHLRYLEPLRKAMGWPIGITSFVRETDGNHSGPSLDFQPYGFPPELRAQDKDAAKLFSQRLEDMFNWLRTHPDRRVLYGTIIDERNHIHGTVPGWQGRRGIAYREPFEGIYTLVKDHFHLFTLGAIALGAWIYARS